MRFINNCSSGVYSITNIKNNKVYIGSSKAIGVRLGNHFELLIKNRHHCKRLQEDFNQHGIGSFRINVMETGCFNSPDSLHRVEQEWINKFRDEGFILYNSNNAHGKIAEKTDESKFVQYINTKWLVPPDTPKEEFDKYKIWREEDKSEIVQMCIKCKMLAVPDRLVTFSRVIKLLEGCLGYVIDSGRIVRCNQRYTYKLVVSYEEENNTYSGVIAGENDFINAEIPQQYANT
ncbi:GIY-YIG nuclease family protein [candidate division WWE3 bacterium]|uniref:GIY-YIG nuclease family protein n=1 Tax=candidate division WWE3 bacterium TaxID=2053526 RepID=A0A7X9DJT5_UNCKA|nr:GIY-YIG nuclease family protein [candidate division WWE3 bacterium]